MTYRAPHPVAPTGHASGQETIVWPRWPPVPSTPTLSVPLTESRGQGRGWPGRRASGSSATFCLLEHARMTASVPGLPWDGQRAPARTGPRRPLTTSREHGPVPGPKLVIQVTAAFPSITVCGGGSGSGQDPETASLTPAALLTPETPTNALQAPRGPAALSGHTHASQARLPGAHTPPGGPSLGRTPLGAVKRVVDVGLRGPACGADRARASPAASPEPGLSFAKRTAGE